MIEILSDYIYFEDLCSKDSEGKSQLDWAKNLKPCESSFQFKTDAIWVILCSGISYKTARTMEEKYFKSGICRHPHKNKAILSWESNYSDWWGKYKILKTDPDRMAFLKTLPYMKEKDLVFQLSKNLGMTGFCKSDVHLKMISVFYGYKDPQELYGYISTHTGHSIAYIFTVLWFSAMKKWFYKMPYLLCSP